MEQIIAPWGAKLSMNFNEHGNPVTNAFPLCLSISWETYNQNPNYVSIEFKATNEPNSLFISASTPGCTENNSCLVTGDFSKGDKNISAIILPGDLEFLKGISVSFYTNESKP